MLKETVVGERSVIIADTAKLHSPVHSIFKMLAVQHVVGSCLAEELGPFC